MDTIEDMDSALVLSRETDRPLFLYWGTKWCPPCAEVQVSVLRQPLFGARSASMVNVAIDGDALGAQACGERVGTDVYPTLMILDHQEREWLRLPGGLTEEVFARVLDAALRRRTPMALLADALGDTGRFIDDDALTLLAFHYWPLDRRVWPGSERLALLDRLEAATATADPEVAFRVLTWQLVERSGRPSAETSPQIRLRLHDRFLELLHSRQATFATLYYLLVSLEPVVSFLAADDEGRRRGLVDALLGVLERIVDDEALSWTQRLIAQSANVGLRAGSQSVAQTQALVARADAETARVTERQSVMNMAGHLLRQSGLPEDSIRLFRAEIGRSPWPTYFMPYVAEIYMEQSDQDEAFQWWRRSYEETKGKTTRFELGVRYVTALVRHAPQERTTIESTVARLFREHGNDADMGRGRIRKSIGLLAQTLSSWQT